jgi:hypothetical protein
MAEILRASEALGLPDILVHGPMKPQTLVRVLGVREKPLLALCEALVVSGYIDGDAERGFFISASWRSARQVPKSAEVADIAFDMPPWQAILEGLRRPLEGRPLIPLDASAAQVAGSLVRERFPKAGNVLVVGDPSGQMGRELLKAGLQVSVAPGPGTTVELPAGAHPVEWPADPDKFGAYGLVALVMATVHSSWQENSMLFFNAARTMARHGGLAVVDWIVGSGLGAALVNLVVSLHGDGGQVYSELDFRMWMKSAGFVGITFQALSPPGLQLILAQKGGRG